MSEQANSTGKMILGGVVGLLIGATATYGATTAMQNKTAESASEVPGLCAADEAGSTVESSPLFTYEGREFYLHDLPPSVQSQIFEERTEAHGKLTNVLQTLVLRVELAKRKGAKVENPETWDALPELQDLVEKPTVSEEDAKKMFEQYKSQLPPGSEFEQMKPMIMQSMERQKIGEVLRGEYDSFEKAGRFALLLAAPTAPVVNLDLTGQPSRGNSESTTKVAVVTDYFCNHCRARGEEYDKAVEELGKDVQFVFMTFPLQPEGLGVVLARGDFCAVKQDPNKYWAYRMAGEKTPYEAARATTPNPDEEFMNHALDAARKADLDPKLFAECLNSEEAKAHVNKTKDMLAAAGVNATPTVFINNRKMMLREGEMISVVRKAMTEQ